MTDHCPLSLKALLKMAVGKQTELQNRSVPDYRMKVLQDEFIRNLCKRKAEKELQRFLKRVKRAEAAKKTEKDRQGTTAPSGTPSAKKPRLTEDGPNDNILNQEEEDQRSGLSSRSKA